MFRDLHKLRQEQPVAHLHDVCLVHRRDLFPVVEERKPESVLRRPPGFLLRDDFQRLDDVRHDLVLEAAVLSLRVLADDDDVEVLEARRDSRGVEAVAEVDVEVEGLVRFFFCFRSLVRVCVWKWVCGREGGREGFFSFGTFFSFTEKEKNAIFFVLFFFVSLLTFPQLHVQRLRRCIAFAQRREKSTFDTALVLPNRVQDVLRDLLDGLATRRRPRHLWEALPDDRRAELGDDVLDGGRDLRTDAVPGDQRDRLGLGVADGRDVGDDGSLGGGGGVRRGRRRGKKKEEGKKRPKKTGRVRAAGEKKNEKKDFHLFALSLARSLVRSVLFSQRRNTKRERARTCISMPLRPWRTRAEAADRNMTTNGCPSRKKKRKNDALDRLEEKRKKKWKGKRTDERTN